MVDAWFIAEREGSVGPFDLAELKSVLNRNPKWREALVWQDGYRDWQRAGKVQEIVALFAAPLPTPETSAVALPKTEPKKSTARPLAKMLIGISILTAAVACGLSWIVITGGASKAFSLFSSKAAMDLEMGFADATKKIRAILPKQVDATTILTQVDYEGKTMLYKHIILMDGARFDAAMKEKLQQSVIKNICSKAEMRGILDLGGSFRYLYFDVGARPIFAIDIGKQNCP